jgi:hypothetical protein
MRPSPSYLVMSLLTRSTSALARARADKAHCCPPFRVIVGGRRVFCALYPVKSCRGWPILRFIVSLVPMFMTSLA